MSGRRGAPRERNMTGERQSRLGKRLDLMVEKEGVVSALDSRKRGGSGLRCPRRRISGGTGGRSRRGIVSRARVKPFPGEGGENRYKCGTMGKKGLSSSWIERNKIKEQQVE